jgi:CheY-like chemotaxis protein
VIQECRAMIEPQAIKRGITVEFPYFSAPCFVYADRTRAKQVLINLLSNAIKYNSVDGSVVVSCVAGATGRIRICVRDTGEGLSAEMQGQLFQPFNRLGKEANSEEGTGIGLVMTKRLVELMGGIIGVESTVGAGSVFWIELKLAAKPQVDAQTGLLADLGELPIPTGRPAYTLLYIEDNPANLMLVEDLIARRPDIHLLSALDGNQGVEVARRTLPNVILMDINLPGISGITALKILRDDPRTSHIPVIALSANAMRRDIEKGLEAGFFAYLTKPINLNEFTLSLDTALRFAQERAADSHMESAT